MSISAVVLAVDLVESALLAGLCRVLLQAATQQTSARGLENLN